ncbi:MAG: WYL domain-containing protein [Thermoanaerobacterales bacterium]|nr:WYL domain-containing protein [Thermoanaerobacterales bacterium]
MGMGMGKNGSGLSLERNSLWRIYKIDQYVRAGLYPNVPWLVEKLEVSARTVERDIACMRDLMSAPIVYSKRRNGYYYARNDFRLPGITLAEGELVALFLGQKILSQCRGTPFEVAVRRAFHKICMALPDEVTVNLGFVEQTISFGINPPRGDEAALLQTYHQLTEAMRARRSIRITYYTASRDDCAERLVDPYHLHFRDGAWYLIGYCHWRREVRIFALDRIRQLTVTNVSFIPDKDFNIVGYLGDSLGIERGGGLHAVAVRFDREQARYVRERQWHPSQEIEELDNGGLILRLNVAGLGEVKRWILSFGAHAEVLEPETLRRDVAATAAALAGVYGSGGGEE